MLLKTRKETPVSGPVRSAVTNGRDIVSEAEYCVRSEVRSGRFHGFCCLEVDDEMDEE